MKLFRLMLILMVMLISFPLPAQAEDTPNYIRLHIPAHSDSALDQAVKLGVRDAVRELTDSLLAGCADADEAWRMLNFHQDSLLHAAEAAARGYGFEKGVSVELGVFPFPDRVYGDELVPAGSYRAVRVVLGEGEGKNWWCVVYPSLCLPEEADAGRPVEFYSSILRWLMKIREAIIL